MNGCITEIKLIRLLGGELDQRESDAVQKHLAACAECRERYRALQAIWLLLGKWEVEPSAFDFAAQVLSSAQVQPARRSWLPLAASILIAAGLGMSAGLLRPQKTSNLTHTVGIVSPDQVANALGLDALGQDAIALQAVLMPPQGSDEQEELNS